MKVSLVVITKDEERNIEKCIRSAPFVDEVIVVDSGSTDRTAEIVHRCGGKFIFNEWPGYGKQKQFAIEQATHDWVLLLDADEYLSSELAEEIKVLASTSLTLDAYRIPRKQIFMGRECHYGKSMDYPLRFVNRTKGAFDLKNIHESFVTKGQEGRLKCHMMHNSGITVLHRCQKIMRDLELELINNDHPSVRVKNIVIDPIRYFLSYYLRHQGYKDGAAGFVMTALFAIQIFLQNSAQYEKNLSRKREGSLE